MMKDMNKYVLAFGLFGCIATTSAQSKWDSTYRPDIYPHLVALSLKYPQSVNDIVFLGNSITYWGNWMELLDNRYVKNRGIPGDITYGLLDRLQYIVDGKPSKVFIMIGINDLARNIPDSVILSNYKRMVRQIKAGSPSTTIYFQTLLPTNRSFGKMKNHYGKDEQIVRINAALAALALQESFQLINLYQHFANEQGQLKEVYTWDGVHLTAEGYQLWAEVLKRERYLD
jgi:lysophospholipase L1-like esterase